MRGRHAPVERLRSLLEERGVPYDAPTEFATAWKDPDGHPVDSICTAGRVFVSHVATPEQAIAATLGRPTWRNSYDQQRYDQWYNSLFHGEPSSFKELIEDVIWTTETVDLGPNGNECQGVDEGEVNTESVIATWAKKAATLGSEINGDTSDGYHTFNELYHHRAVLFSVIVRDHRELAWKAYKHHDGTMYDGMFIVGIETPSGQATYHYDLDPYWDMFDCEEREFAPEWDGHTPDEAIARIATLGRGTCEWILEHSGTLYDKWRCSKCGYLFIEPRCDQGYTDLDPNFCPNCGREVVNA